MPAFCTGIMAHWHSQIVTQLNFANLVDGVGEMTFEDGLDTGKDNVRISSERIRYFFQCRETMCMTTWAPALKAFQKYPFAFLVRQPETGFPAPVVDPVTDFQLRRFASRDSIPWSSGGQH